MFPRSWYTIPKEGTIIVVDFHECESNWRRNVESRLANGEALTEKELDSIVDIRLRGEFYKTMEEVVQELNLASIGAFTASRVDESINPPVFYYRAITRRIYVTIPVGMSIEFPSSLESILGLTPSQNS